MSAGNYDFNIEQGTSFRMSLVYKDANGDPIDITDWCARLTWRTSSNVTQTFTTENVDLTAYKFEIIGTEGRINFLLPAATTNSFNFNTAKYDLELQADYDHYANGGGKYTVRIIYGTVTIMKRNSKYDTALECQP